MGFDEDISEGGPGNGGEVEVVCRIIGVEWEGERLGWWWWE